MEGKRVTGEIWFISSTLGIFLPECNNVIGQLVCEAVVFLVLPD